jgi:hypothetical protein
LAQQFDQPDTATLSSQATHDGGPTISNGRGRERLASSLPAARTQNRKPQGFDWLSVSIVVLTAAIFAAAGRLYAQPSTSLVPVAVLSASGCGLLITAFRKLRTSKGTGLAEAALAGLCVAVLQFLSALSYPGVLPSLGNNQIAGSGFFTTWVLIAIFSILFSIIGAVLGHLAFAPLRPLPPHKIRPARQPYLAASEPAESPDLAGADEPAESTHEVAGVTSSAGEQAATVQEQHEDPTQDDESAEQEHQDEQSEQPVTPQRSTISYVITILLLGLVPMLAGYVFAASFDYMLSRNGYAPGFFPTLRLLSSLLPWQIPVPPSGLQGASAVAFTVSQLWRIPIFFGNPAPFDVQALEPYIFNASALALLLATSFKQEGAHDSFKLPRGKLVLFETLLALVLVLPAAIWMLQGLEGVLQLPNIVAPIGTIHLLDPLSFVLDLITAVLICIATGTIVISRSHRR